MNKKTSQKWYIPVRRVLVYALAAVLMLTGMTSVALAASPEFRMAVLSFFHMEEREQVPGQPDVSQGETSGQPDISQDESSGQSDISHAEIGNLVKAQYIKIDQYYGLSGDLLNNLTWSEDYRTLLDSRFWEIKDDNLIPVQVDMQTSQIDVAFQDIHYQGNLYWFIRNGKLYFFHGSPYPADMRPEDE